MKLIRILVSLSIFIMALSLTSAQDAQTPQDICDAATPGELTEMQFDAPEQVLEDGVDYRAIFCTEAGAVYVDLFEDLAPITVNSFVFLAEQGYYDNTTFHRVIEDFMAQAGDPTATGSGGPGYQFEDEPISFLVFDRPGLLAMANAGAGTNGSQFFITTAQTEWLNYQHTIFGEVLEGQDNVVNLRVRDPETDTEAGASLDTVIIVTDPSTVETTYIAAEPATQEDVAAAIEGFLIQLPEEFPIDEEVSGLFTTEEVVASVPADFEEGFAEFAETYGHQYRYTTRILNGECDTNQFFSFLRYTVDAFEDADSASAALADDFPNELATANGLELIEGSEHTYSLATQTCSGDEGVYGMTLYTRGRYLVTVEALVTAETMTLVDMDTLLVDNIASPFEAVMSSIYLPEIRSE